MTKTLWRTGCSRPRTGWLGVRPPGGLALAAAGLVAAFWSPGCSPGDAPRNHPRHLGKPHVVLVSFDGFRHDYMEMFDTPNFDRVAAGGARAEALVPVFPSLTFPSHYSIATGMYPGSHGLVANTFYDREWDRTYSLSDRETVEDGAWYGGEPIWVTAERQEMLSAAFFFVGTEADVGGIRPSRWKRFDPEVPNEARADTVVAWLGLPPEERPHFVSMYFADVDYAGHRFGPGDDVAELAEAVARVDRALGRLLDGLAGLPHGRQIHVVLVSDHGMGDVLPEGHYALDDIADLSGARLTSGGTAGILFVEGGDERIEELRIQLDEGMPRADVHRPRDAPSRLHLDGHPRFGDLVIVPDEGYTVGVGPRRGSSLGMHGWDPRFPSMHGIFLAMGPGIDPGARLPRIEAVDIYPFVARVLGLDPAGGIQGDPEALAELARE